MSVQTDPLLDDQELCNNLEGEYGYQDEYDEDYYDDDDLCDCYDCRRDRGEADDGW